VAEPVEMLKKIGQAFDAAGIERRSTPLDGKSTRPKRIITSTRWELIDGFWIQKNPAPNSFSSYEKVKSNLKDEKAGDSKTREKAEPLFKKMLSHAV